MTTTSQRRTFAIVRPDNNYDRHPSSGADGVISGFCAFALNWKSRWIGVATKRVLIVDDNEDITTLLRLQLERTPGVEVVGVAAHGLEAIAIATLERPDVILLDLMMPVMGGLEALPLLKQELPDCTVIVLSAAAMSTERDRALEAGAQAYYVK